MLLKVMKLKDKKVGEVYDQLLCVEKMILELESATQSVAVFDALANGTQALNQLNSEFSLDRIEELLEDSKEAIEVRIFIIISTSISFFVMKITSLTSKLLNI